MYMQAPCMYMHNMCLYVNVRMYVHVSTCMCVYMYVHVYVHVSTCVCMCMHVYVYVRNACQRHVFVPWGYGELMVYVVPFSAACDVIVWVVNFPMIL